MKTLPLTLSIELPDELDVNERLNSLTARVSALEKASILQTLSAKATEPMPYLMPMGDENEQKNMAKNNAEEPSKEPAEEPKTEDEAPDAEMGDEPAAPAPAMSPNDTLRSLGNV